MTIWLPGITLSLITTGVLVFFLYRHQSSDSRERNKEIDIYLKQFNELATEREKGIIDADEEAKIKTELGRKILTCNHKLAQQPDPKMLSPKSTLALAVGLGFFLILGTQLIHTKIGHPGYPDQPIKVRLEETEASINSRMSTARMFEVMTGKSWNAEIKKADEMLNQWAELKAEDSSGYVALLRQSFEDSFERQNFAQASHYKRELISLLGNEASVQDYLGLANAMVLATNLYITPEGEEVISKVLTLDENNYTANFYLGLMFSQVGRPDQTFEIWNSLLSKQPNTQNIWKYYIQTNLNGMAARAGLQ